MQTYIFKGNTSLGLSTRSDKHSSDTCQSSRLR